MAAYGAFHRHLWKARTAVDHMGNASNPNAAAACTVHGARARRSQPVLSSTGDGLAVTSVQRCATSRPEWTVRTRLTFERTSTSVRHALGTQRVSLQGDASR